MAVITVCEYAEMPLFEGNQKPPIAQEPCIRTKTYVIGVGTAQSDVFSDACHYVWIDVDIATRFEFGADPAALPANTGAKTGSKRIPADASYFTGTKPGHRVAFLLA